jgi:Fe-S cluster assembly protein SufD
MTTTTDSLTQTTPVLDGWLAKAAEQAVKSGEPDWALARRRQAVAHASSLPFPSRTDELWRRTDLGGLSLETLDPFRSGARARNVDDLPATVLARLAGEAGNLGLLVQRDATVTLEQTHPALEKQGVIVCSLDRALKEHADKVKPLLGSMLAPDTDKYVAIGEAVRQGGAFVWVPDGVEAALPIRLVQWLDGAGRAVFPRTVIALGKGARATVIEEQLSDEVEGASFYGGGIEAFVGEDARLVFATLQEWGRNVYHYSNARARVGRAGELQWIQTTIGGRTVKSNAYFDLDGPGAQAFVHGFMFGDGRQHFHLHTLQRHLKDHTTSDLLIKSCLKDRARSVYQGLIQVSEGAQRTDAYQANRNLLLSDTARADSIPGLEILANDVRCTHGATIGQVDEEQLYYLMARGLPEREAKRLIVEAFFEPVLARIPLEPVRDQLRAEIERKIGTV